MSIEIRHVIVGDCDCGTPKYSWVDRECHEHYWECDYGRVTSFDRENPAPLVVVSRDWALSVFKAGGERTIGDCHYTIRFVPVPDESGEVTETSEVRLFHSLSYMGRSWTWELEPAHWADSPTRSNNARIPIYLGRWRD